jgi:hypothetical protein
MNKQELFKEAFALLKRAQALLLAARAKHEAKAESLKRAA